MVRSISDCRFWIVDRRLQKIPDIPMYSSGFYGSFMTIRTKYGLNITDLTLPEKHIKKAGHGSAFFI